MSEGNKVGVDVVRTDVLGFLKDLAGGRVCHQLAADVEAVVKGILETGKPGKVRLTLTIGP